MCLSSGKFSIILLLILVVAFVMTAVCALSNLEITSDPVSDSVYSFAEKADALGYLGRNGYDLSEIFYTIDSNSNVGEGT